MRCFRYLIFALLFFFNLNLASASVTDSIRKEVTVRTNTPIEILRDDLQSFLENPDFGSAFIGIDIRSCRTGRTIFSKNSSKNFIPASLTKLFTTSAALVFLKPDFKYSTKIYLDGKIQKNGVFKGDIIIRGAGNPTNSDVFYQESNLIYNRFAVWLDSLGIKEVRGNIIADDRYFDHNFYAPGWSVDDLIYPYAAPICALSVNENRVKIFLKPGKSIGDKASLTFYPDNHFIKILNDVKTVSPVQPKKIEVSRGINDETISIKGELPFDSTHSETTEIAVSILEPIQYTLGLFKNSLQGLGIKVKGALLDYSQLDNYDINYRKLSVSFQAYSPLLSNIISNINKTSNNFAAEMVLKTLAKETSGYGSFSAGIDIVKNLCLNFGIPSENIVLYDGSGISRYNLLQPKYVVQLLFKMYLSKYKDVFISSLARPGGSGTLSQRMRNTNVRDRVFAKTGTMNNVSNIAGYVMTADDEYFAFAIMVMNHNTQESIIHNLQDLICMRLANFSNKISIKTFDSNN